MTLVQVSARGKHIGQENFQRTTETDVHPLDMLVTMSSVLRSASQSTSSPSRTAHSLCVIVTPRSKCVRPRPRSSRLCADYALARRHGKMSQRGCLPLRVNRMSSKTFIVHVIPSAFAKSYMRDLCTDFDFLRGTLTFTNFDSQTPCNAM